MSDPIASEPAGSSARTPGSRFNGPSDMVLYAALVGKSPKIDPTLADPLVAATEARRENPWSPMVLSVYIHQVCRQQATKINKPELSAWVRRQSDLARRRFQETQNRMFEMKNGRAA